VKPVAFKLIAPNMLTHAREMLRTTRRVVSFSGAGLSAESGIPTFRDAQTGFWAKYDPARLASPEGFVRDPELVVNWYNDRRRQMSRVQPNPAHAALAAHPDITHVTQNIDDLLHRAGALNVVQLHGTITTDRCHAECGYEEQVDLNDPPGLRHCPNCGEHLRPSVVWFGEVLPQRAWLEAEQACTSCDVLLVIGTSAEVYPAAGLIDLAHSAGAKIIVINTQPSAASGFADIEIIGPAGELVPRILDRGTDGRPDAMAS
jgi:NAD-dependent deacetylase